MRVRVDNYRGRKPVGLRRFGPYTMPILWGDRLVGRFDARMDRATGTLVINGLWLEDEALAREDAFAEALRRGMDRLATFLDALAIEASAVADRKLRSAVKASGQIQAVVNERHNLAPQ